jgi:hypothetical protein
MDVTEISFEALRRKMSEGNEGFSMAASVLEHVTLDLTIAPAVTVLLLKTTEDLHGGVALLGRRLLVIR